jgi:hypothetical protein
LDTCEVDRNDGDNTLKEQRMLVTVPNITCESREPRDDNGVGSTQKESAKIVVGVNGLFGVRPIILRTRSGDLPLAGSKEQGVDGAISGRGVCSSLGVINGPNHLGFDFANSSQDQIESVSIDLVGLSDEVNIENPGTFQKGKKRHSHKRKHHVYFNGSKFQKLQEAMSKKGGGTVKKTMHKGKKGRRQISIESDPICSVPTREGDSVRNSNGIMLEVVPQSGGDLHSTATSPRRYGGGAVLRDGGEQGGRNPSAVSTPSRGGGLDRDRIQAEHVIDILEDVGMDFEGEKEDVINRIAAYEVRDRSELLAGEQRHVF